MSDLFYTGQRKRTSGGFSVSCAGGKELAKRLRKLENGGEVAIKRTVSDFSSRAPGWVSKGVRAHYGVDATAVKEAVKRPKRGKNATTLKAAGIQVDGAALVYNGRLLTPTHFKMKPPARPAGNKKYKVTAAIIKGKRVTLAPGAFLAGASKNENSKVIPWQRTGDGRLPVHVIKTLSVPQMTGGIGEDGVDHVSLASGTIRSELDKGLSKRFEHHIKQAMK